MSQPSDILIARQAKLSPISEIADGLGLDRRHLLRYGEYKAKISLDAMDELKDKKEGKLILVAGITPTPAGEGKTTTTVGLGDALRRIGKSSAVCLREPSLGPCFGVKGGAAGGGYAQVVPMEDINLHFTGDIHAIGTAHNLLSAMLDNHIYWGNELGIDSRRVIWRRVVDMNDRSLRSLINGLGGPANGFPRADGFDLTVASEVMAILCLSQNMVDLRERLSNILVARTRDRREVYARDLKAHGPMAVLLRDALSPNLVQTLEKTPAFVHGGPFANIAHGCNSALATRLGLKLADYVITEAGFGADLGAEKFFDIKCRKTGLKPDCAVIVATLRAVKMHGGVALSDAGKANVEAVQKGFDNVWRHVENTRKFGLPVVVALNRFSSDTDEELEAFSARLQEIGIDGVVCEHWERGGAGAEDLALKVLAVMDEQPSAFKYLYPDDMPLWDKIETVAREIYCAEKIIADKKVRDEIALFQDSGRGNLPVCIAKTPLSFTTDPGIKGIPSGHVVPVREVRLSNGAGFLLAICGDISIMPGLPRVPAAEAIDIDENGLVEGLF